MELQNIRAHKLSGSLIRSRVKWIEYGEKPSRYFCHLESRNYTSKIIPKIIDDNDEEITDQREILSEVERFYRCLYSKNDNEVADLDLSSEMADFEFNTLDNNDKNSLDGKITYQEASKTLKNMANNKSPGSDGFSAEFFKMFWKKLGHFVVRSLNHGYDTGELSVTQKQGVITCIPKDGKPRQYLKNWRPISLLNVVYKIASGCVSMRLKTCIHKLISSDQTGFVPGRYIGENTRLVYDIMQFADENDIPGVLLMIDFEKAFDSVSWDFIDKTLKLFNFGESFRKWVKLFQNKSNSAVCQAGFLSSFFPLHRGCRQGDPISSYLFLLCAEILAIRIKGNKNIRGITINDIEHIMSPYADDTLLILDGTEIALREAIREINLFYRMSGLKMNLSKTQIAWIGSLKYNDDRLCPDLNFQWTTRFTLLGVIFDVDLSRVNFLNYVKKLVKIKSLISQWSKRRLTPMGRLTVIKTILISQLNHLFISIPNPSTQFLGELKDVYILSSGTQMLIKLKETLSLKTTRTAD